MILNTNNLPDGEVDRRRFPTMGLYLKYLLYDSYFLMFRSAISLLKHSFPLALMLAALNPRWLSEQLIDRYAGFFRGLQSKKKLSGEQKSDAIFPDKK